MISFVMLLMFVLPGFAPLNSGTVEAAAAIGSVASQRMNGNSTADAEFREQFFRLCDYTVTRIRDGNRKDPFFLDSYGVRGLCAAYDMTGNQKYLDSCCAWAEEMIGYQKRMIPANAYYMNYGRKPGEKKGYWFAADCSSIGMGVLATAVRCDGAERSRLLDSVERFVSLVLKNYSRPSGGITDGLWTDYNGTWWCSSALFGSLCFNLYASTGNQRYLKAGLKVVDWMNEQDLEKVQPLPLSHQGPSLPMYVLETYSAGWPYLSKDSARKEAALAQISWCLKWTAEQQELPFSERKWKLTDWWGAKYGGLPFHQYIFSKYIPSDRTLATAGDEEMQRLAGSMTANKAETAQLAMFMMMSYAERLNPGAIYRAIQPKQTTVGGTSH